MITDVRNWQLMCLEVDDSGGCNDYMVHAKVKSSFIFARFPDLTGVILPA